MILRWLLMQLATANVQVRVQSQGEQDYSIEAKAAEFSSVPYGGYLQGAAVKVPSRLCNSYDVQMNPLGRYVFVIERGDCEFSTKVLNAQRAGAIAAIIYDNVQEELMTMGSEGQIIDIPAIFVQRDDGLRIMRTPNMLSLNITFVTGHYSRPSLELVLTGLPSFSRTLPSTLSTLRTLSPYLTYKPYYMVLKCQSCGTYTAPVRNCLGGGRYCSRQGKGFLQEVIRQECIREGNYSFSQYLDYMETWSAQCLNRTGECVEGYEIAGIDKGYVDRCYQTSFHPSFSLISFNSILEHVQHDFISFAPVSTLYLSGEAFQGTQTGSAVQRALCAMLLSPPSLCFEGLCSADCWPELLGNQACDGACNHTSCQLDQGDCPSSVQPIISVCAPGCSLEEMENTLCDLHCNVSACGYDQGNCNSADVYIPESTNFPYKFLFLM